MELQERCPLPTCRVQTPDSVGMPCVRMVGPAFCAMDQPPVPAPDMRMRSPMAGDAGSVIVTRAALSARYPVFDCACCVVPVTATQFTSAPGAPLQMWVVDVTDAMCPVP